MKLVKQNHQVDNTSLMNWFFDDVLTQNAFNAGRSSASIKNTFKRPETNIIKNEGSYSLELATPGFEKEDFQLDIIKNNLSITAETKSVKDTKEKTYTNKEFNYGSIKRSFTLPEHTDLDNISAEYKNGILIVNLPIKEEEKKTVQISVK